MTGAMIDDVVAAFAVAARRCATAAWTVSSCTAPTATSSASSCRRPPTCATTATAARPRAGRGSCVEILEAIRGEVGPGFPVGVRLSGTDFIEGGIDPAEAAAIARTIEPLIDFLDVSMSSYWRFHKFLSTLDDPLGYEIETSEQVTKAVGVPTIVTGRILALDHADHLIGSGVADMVSMVRAMVADPHLVAKAERAGRTRSGPASARAWAASPN